MYINLATKTNFQHKIRSSILSLNSNFYNNIYTFYTILYYNNFMKKE